MTTEDTQFRQQWSETQLFARLAVVFGEEWEHLSDADKDLIVRDCTEDGGVSDLDQYRHNIGRGNLFAYVKTQRVRFK